MTDARKKPPRRGPRLGGRDLLLLSIFLLAGGAIRLLYLGEIGREPVFHAPVSDAAFHDYWAKGIVSGDWTPPPGNRDPRIPEVPFLRPPGYAYFLALVYAALGPDVQTARVVQMVLGLANAVLAFFLARALFGRAAGHAAAAFTAFYWAFVYYEAQLHAPAPTIALGFALLLFLVSWSRGGETWKVLVAGLLTGLLALFRAEALLFVPAAALWIAWAQRSRRPGRRTAIVPAAVFFAASLAAIAPATIRNAVIAKELVLVSANGPINLYVGNNETSDGVTTRIPALAEIVGSAGWSCFSYDGIVREICRKEGKVPSYSEASRIFTSKALDFIAQNPSRFIILTLKRAALFWGPEEVANNTAIRYEKANSSVLRWIPGFPIVLGPSLLGAVFLLAGWRRRKAGSAEVLLVALFVLTGFAAQAPFIAAARFRVPYIPFVFLFGAYALARVGLLAREHRWKPLAAAAGGLAALTVLASIPVSGHRTDAAWWRTDRAMALWRADRKSEAIAEFEEALRANPGFVDAHVNFGGLLAETGRGEEAIGHWREVLEYRPERTDVRFRLGALLLEAGRSEEAARELRTVVRENPGLGEAWFELGRALIEIGDFTGSREAFERSLELMPDEPGAFVNQAIGYRQSGRPREALAPLQRAIQLKPDYALAHIQLGLAYADLGETESARAAFQELLRLEPENPDPLIHLGVLASKANNLDEAMERFRQALAIDPNNTTARYNLGGMLSTEGRIDEAIAEFERVLRIDPAHAPARRQIDLLRSMKR